MRVWWALVFAALFAFPAQGGRVVVDWEYDYVNIRSAPDLSGEPIGRLMAGAGAERVQTEGDWALIRFPGGEGWVVDRSLQPQPPPPPMGEPASEPPTVAQGAPAEASQAPAPPQRRPEPDPTAPASGTAGSATPPGVQPPAPSSKPDATGTPVGAPPEELLPPDEPPAGGYLAEYAERPEVPAFDSGPSVVSVLSGLLLVLALIAGTVYLARRFWLNRFSEGRRPGGIRILASRPMGPRQALVLVEVGGLVWLVAQSQEGLRLIAPVEDEQALERLNDRYEFRQTAFESELKRSLDLESEVEQESEQTEPAPDQPTAEQRLAALRRRGKAREPS